MATEGMYVNERLDHLGIVAGVSREIGLATWLYAQDPVNRHQASVGKATVAMILNGLGFSNRQLYLVPQYFANKPVEHLLGTGISADMLNEDCRDCESRPIDLWSQNRPSACGHQLVFREWRVHPDSG